MFAASKGHEAIVKLLLEHEADLVTKNKVSITHSALIILEMAYTYLAFLTCPHYSLLARFT